MGREGKEKSKAEDKKSQQSIILRVGRHFQRHETSGNGAFWATAEVWHVADKGPGVTAGGGPTGAHRPTCREHLRPWLRWGRETFHRENACCFTP